MAFTRIKRIFFNARFHKYNKHYKTTPVVGERANIKRANNEPVEVIFYYPEQRENMPVFVQIHGGGWVGMDAVDDDQYCARLAKELGAFVVNVNYKRMYEEGFPYQHEEIVSTVKWLKKNAAQLGIDQKKIVLSGGSAGGHITAGSSIMLAQQGITIAGQIMEVPFLDFTKTIEIDFPDGDQLYKLMFELYPSKLPLDSAVISPAAKASDEIIKKLAPAVVIVCGKDPLHPHGERYAEKLKQFGKLADFKMYENGYHGFGTDKAEEMPGQAALREECFWYKVQQARHLFSLSNAEKHDKA